MIIYKQKVSVSILIEIKYFGGLMRNKYEHFEKYKLLLTTKTKEIVFKYSILHAYITVFILTAAVKPFLKSLMVFVNQS